ncbi:type IV secretion protein [Renibacterium salmoninarum ATCC 33209]|uniref:Type IV secretion protein n=1 Tax=Renibacterium salmoninarum (strain ATCC 33209 / DSM 20767 / JCM 11484 / NBRC 15589 / NCIMB 2235) TaxID=288705 RepID=A9WP78_RENSM|nr:type IV secretion protein [Renibacterium salmoninarum ATCC 33209]
MLAWCEPGQAKEPFDPVAFVGSTDSLFLLSQEGTGSAGPIVAALVKAVLSAAEKKAATNGGRLPVPLVAVLDEAANICRIPELPDKYSHYGSRGIMPITILQSYEQGEEAWGRAGMAKLFSAANLTTVGGSITSTDFLKRVSDLIGTYQYNERTVSYNSGGQGRPGGTSIGSQRHTENILEVSDLAALPADRIVVISSACPPVLAKTTP